MWNNNMNNDFIPTTPPIHSISFYIDLSTYELIIFHKKHDSLIKFSLISNDKTEEEISHIIYKELSHLDWDKDFSEIINTEKYRKALYAVMNDMYT